MLSGPGKGEVGTILHGAFMVIGVLGAAVFFAIGFWVWFWHLRWLRRVGFAALVCGLLFMMFGQNVQWWLRDMRMDRMEALAQKRQQVETDLLQTLRALTDDPVTAVALYDVYMDRINKRDMYNGRYTGRWDSFAVFHVAYMFVFFDRGRAAEHGNRRPPYAGLYCSFFKDAFGDLVVTDDQRERALVACPDAFSG
ncbi:MAG: hypothetical protein ACSHWY_09820 [Octadecabacter sp.]